MSDENLIGTMVVEEAINLHRDLGPGLLESVYERALCRKLEKKGIQASRQVAVPIVYDGETYEEAFRADIIVESKVILEIKSIESIHNAHRKQLLTYLKLTGIKLGYLLNFSEGLMKDGITRIINGLL